MLPEMADIGEEMKNNSYARQLPFTQCCNDLVDYAMLHPMLERLLLKHPQEIGETYAEHASHALWIGLRMIAAGLACLVHALIPGLCIRTASRTVESITGLMETRSNKERPHTIEPIAG
jgi:hypothetical protein